MAEGNFILLEGPSNAGKLGFALDTGASFLKRHEKSLNIVVTFKRAKFPDSESIII